jgi:hypothetical protein
MDDDDLRRFLSKEHAAGKRPPYLVAGEPTAEVIVEILANVSVALLEQGKIFVAGEWQDGTPTELRVDQVEVFETPNCSATWTRPLKIEVTMPTTDPDAVWKAMKETLASTGHRHKWLQNGPDSDVCDGCGASRVR